jgi:hypothetical protein
MTNDASQLSTLPVRWDDVKGDGASLDRSNHDVLPAL